MSTWLAWMTILAMAVSVSWNFGYALLAWETLPIARKFPDGFHNFCHTLAWGLRPITLPASAFLSITRIMADHHFGTILTHSFFFAWDVALWIMQPHFLDKNDRRGKKKPSKLMEKVKSIGHRLVVVPTNA